MNELAARQFLQCLHAKNIDSKSDGKWLRCSCPLAPYLHQNGKDSNPSFALSISEHESPHFNCFSCQGGTAAELLQRLEMYARQSPKMALPYKFKEAHEILDTEELVPEELEEFQEFKPSVYQAITPWPESFLSTFIHADKVVLAREYLYESKDHLNGFGQKCRGFKPEETHKFDLRYDHSRGMVVFPYRDAFGRLAGMRGRSIVEKKFHDYTWQGVNNASLCWLNETSLEQIGWVVVVEGNFDVVRVAVRWPKVVGNMTAKPIPSKMGKLLSATGTVFIPDNDATGTTSIEKYRSYHQKHHHPFRVLKLPDTVKDADDVHSDYLFDRIVQIVEA